MTPDVVILLHTLSDSTSHFDWLTSVPGVGEGGLLAFRLDHRPDLPGWATQRGIRLPDHRRLYLTYEGEIGGGRGHVRRVARGVCLEWIESDGVISTLQEFDGVRTRLALTHLDGDWWEVVQGGSN